jgi:hypothetical protein
VERLNGGLLWTPVAVATISIYCVKINNNITTRAQWGYPCQKNLKNFQPAPQSCWNAQKVELI